MKAVTAKIELPPTDSQRDVNIESKSAVGDPFSSQLFFLLTLSIFFPFSFLHLPPAFGLFLSQTTAISLCTFSKIQLDKVLGLTVNHTLIFVNVPTSANIRLYYSFKIFPRF